MNDYEDMLERGPTWVWTYAEAHGMEIPRKITFTGYEQIGETHDQNTKQVRNDAAISEV